MSSPQSPSAPPRRAVVIGGGISGLTAAYELVNRGVDCTLVETSDRLGGVIRTDRVGSCLIEAGPDSFIAQKPWALELIRELGLGDQVVTSNDSRRRTYVARNGALIPLPDGIQFLAPTRILPVLTTRLLGVGSKLRMLAEWFRRPRDLPGDRSIGEFVLDHYGREMNEYLAQPMLAGVYGGSPEQLSLNAVMPQFAELERTHGSVSRGMLAARRQAPPSQSGSSLFLTLRGGMQQLVDELVSRIRDKAQIIHHQAQALERTGSGYRITLDNGELEADTVILAVAAWGASALLHQLDGVLAADLGRIPYHSSVTASFLYGRPPFEHPLDGFGFLVPRREQRTISACTWVNTKFNFRAPDNKAMLRAFLAGESAERHLGDSDKSLADAVAIDLKQLMRFDVEPEEVRIARWDRAMAQYQVGHLALKRDIEERLIHHTGLYISGNAFDGIGVPDCIRRSRAIVRGMFESR